MVVAEIIPAHASLANGGITGVPPHSGNVTVFKTGKTGEMVSCTLTVAAQVAALPFTSVTVNTTGLIPAFAQVKLLLFNVNDAIPHASIEPLLIWLCRYH